MIREAIDAATEAFGRLRHPEQDRPDVNRLPAAAPLYGVTVKPRVVPDDTEPIEPTEAERVRWERGEAVCLRAFGPGDDQ